VRELGHADGEKRMKSASLTGYEKVKTALLLITDGEPFANSPASQRFIANLLEIRKQKE
jgi:hypothetical protein